MHEQLHPTRNRLYKTAELICVNKRVPCRHVSLSAIILRMRLVWGHSFSSILKSYYHGFHKLLYHYGLDVSVRPRPCLKSCLFNLQLSVVHRESTLAHAMLSCRQATNNFRSQCWPRYTLLDVIPKSPVSVLTVLVWIVDCLFQEMTPWIRWSSTKSQDVNASPPRANASMNRVSIGSDNGLSPIRRQAVI